MSRTRSRRRYAALLCLLSVLMIGPVVPGQAQPVRTAAVPAVTAAVPAVTAAVPAVTAAFTALTAHVSGLPATALTRPERTSLLTRVGNAEVAYRQDRPCGAAPELDAYLGQAQAIRRTGRQPVAEDLYNRGESLLTDVLVTARVRCAGHERVGAEPAVALRESDNRHVSGVVGLGEPRMWTRNGGGEVFTQLDIPGIDAKDGAVGQPAVPVFRTLVGVPKGAGVAVRATARVANTVSLNLFPFQGLPIDEPQGTDGEEFPPELFADQPFTKDARAYATNAAFPAGDACVVSLIGQDRDLVLAQLSCPAARYNPVTDAMTFFSAIEFDVVFSGGSGAFVTDAALNPFDRGSRTAMASVINTTAVSRHVAVSNRPTQCQGEELLILTHPDFRPAANALREWKQDKGILTSVFNVSDNAGPGPDTTDAIHQFIENRVNMCKIRPSYLLLLGDAEFIPTYIVELVPQPDERRIGTDYPYVTVHVDGHIMDFDVVADLALARMPVDTLAEADTVVQKVIRYEQDPPTDAAFYEKATVASQFQCCRLGDDVPDGTDQRVFAQTSETIRDAMIFEGGVNAVDRIYGKTVDYAGNPAKNVAPYCGDAVKPACDRDPTPRFYPNGSELPADLGPNSGFAWDGTGEDVASAFEDGRFLVTHIDHGSSSGWGTPGFLKTHVNALTNGELLPVVFSINCSSGYFDAETNPAAIVPSNVPVFTEALLRNPNGGAVGVVAGTRTTGSPISETLAVGLVDAIWPNTKPNFSLPLVSRRLGDIVNHGKMYMLTYYGIQHQNAINHLRLYQAFGDPTQEIWAQNPIQLPPLRDIEVREFDLEVHYAEDGAEITAYQESADGVVAIGRASVVNGVARMPYVNRPTPGQPILLSASKDGAVSRTL